VTELRRGCLSLADISGYTRYLGGVELEHSQDILADLLGTVAKELEAGIGPVAKLEGDAIFVAQHEQSLDGDMLLAALDSAYFAFARRRRTIDIRSSCTCRACAQTESLDLKLIAHHGEYVEHEVAGRPELVGNDVILVHRLLKNHVTEHTGVKAFALLTDGCCRALALDPQELELQPHGERYDDVGEVQGWVRDLGARWAVATETDQVRVDPDEANFSFSQVCHGSAAQVWDALVAPEKVLRWKGGATDVQMENPSGGRGVGSVTHCVHGKQAFDQEILDWRPFSYFSYQETGPYGPFLYTFELAEKAGETALDVRVRLVGGRRQRMIMRLASRKFRAIIGESLAKLGSIVEGDGSRSAI
jgi:class 3 adenylate cyclase